MAARFRDICVGAQLEIDASSLLPGRRGMFYYVVTDMWFDPVRGQHRASGGEMVAIQRLNERGERAGRKLTHTKRGLAANGYRYAAIDYKDLCDKRLAAHAAGDVVGIGHAHVLRRRPKCPRLWQ